ncbi:unnamed protein product [Prunus armeniaca]
MLCWPLSARGLFHCFNCHGFGHITIICPSKASFVPPLPSRLQGMTAQYPSHGGHQQWVADTGANTHITNDLSHYPLLENIMVLTMLEVCLVE